MDDLSTDALASALSAFLARKPKPKTIYCDNQTSFGDLKRQLDVFKNNLRDAASRFPSISWHFMPPRSPHTGGVHERLIGFVKKALQKLLPDYNMTALQLGQLLATIEGLLNQRPIAYVHNGPDEDQVITPNHLLHGTAGEMLVPLNTSATLPFGKRFRQLSQAVRRFWARFQSEYLPSLHSSRKWLNSQRNLKIGDRVLILEKDGPITKYPLGTVIAVDVGRDQLVRSATVEREIDGKKVTRHIRRFRLLHVPGPDDDDGGLTSEA